MKPMATISPEVTKGFEKCCISDEVDGGKLRMLATNMRV
jgi:hypothetical protein